MAQRYECIVHNLFMCTEVQKASQMCGIEVYVVYYDGSIAMFWQYCNKTTCNQCWHFLVCLVP